MRNFAPNCGPSSAAFNDAVRRGSLLQLNLREKNDIFSVPFFVLTAITLNARRGAQIRFTCLIDCLRGEWRGFLDRIGLDWGVVGEPPEIPATKFLAK